VFGDDPGMAKATNVFYHPAASDRPTSRPEASDPPRLPALSDREIDTRLSEETELVRRYIEMATDTLSKDSLLTHRHPRISKDLRQAGSLLKQLAGVVSAADKDLAAEQVMSAELRARLTRKPLKPLFTSAH
jgi:hypothetical protein